MEPQTGASKAAQVLTAGGRFVAMWNHWRRQREVVEVMLAAYQAHALRLRTAVLGIEQPVLPDNDVRAAALAAEGFRGARPGVRETWSWQTVHTPESWLELLRSPTEHRGLEAGERTASSDQLRAGIERLGAQFEVTMLTSAIAATWDRAGGSPKRGRSDGERDFQRPPGPALPASRANPTPGCPYFSALLGG